MSTMTTFGGIYGGKQGLLAQFRAGRVPQPRELEQVRFVLKGPGLRADSAATGSHNPVKDAEAFMVECRDYLEGSFSSGHWVVGEDGVCTSGMSSRQAKDISEAIQSNLYTAVKALKRSEFTEAFKILDISFRSAKKAIESDVPRVLALTLNAMVMLDRHGQEDILRVFLRYVRSQSRSLSGRSQKLARVFDGLSRIDRSLYEDVFELVFGLLVDRSDSMFGAGSYLSFEIFWDYFATMLVQRSFPVQVDRLAKQLAKVDLADRGRPWIARVERLLAWKVAQWKSSTGDEAEAERALRAAEDTLDESSPADEVVLHHQFSGKMYMAMNRLAAAEESFVKALRRQVGDTDQPNLEDSIQYGLSQLAIILDRRGRVQEAEDVRTYAHDRLRRLTADIDWDWDEFARRTAEEKLPGGDDED